MCDNNKFYICEHCGNLIGMINDAGVPMMCCGQKMTELKPGTVEASAEKHIPVVTIEENIVKVEIGSVAHPMPHFLVPAAQSTLHPAVTNDILRNFRV